jgi:hypothetical protein
MSELWKSAATVPRQPSRLAGAMRVVLRRAVSRGAALPASISEVHETGDEVSGRAWDQRRRFDRLGTFLRLPLFAIALVCAYVGLAPLWISLPASGLDPSWRAVLGEAAVRHLSVGKDLIFTGGPLSSVYTGYLDEQLLWTKFGLRFLLVIALAWLIASLAIANRRPLVGILMAIALVASTPYKRDALFLILPMLTALLAIGWNGGRQPIATLLLGVAATAVATLAKFSAPPIAILAFVVADALYLYRGRMPFLSLSYFVVTFALYALVDTPTNFPSYLLDSFNMAAGYVDAMSRPGSLWEIFAFLAVGSLLFSTVAITEMLAARAGTLRWPDAIGRIILISAYVFISWKEGFVRHDFGHIIIGLSGIALAALTYAVVAPHFGERSWLATGPAVILGVLIGYSVLWVAIPWMASVYAPGNPLGQFGPVISAVGDSLNGFRQFAAGPRQWIEQRKAEKKAAWAAIRLQAPLPNLQGTVDVIPSIQSTLLANGLDYKPRPSFQEYGTYTSRLIDLNRRSLVNDGSRLLLFRPGSIDQRHPATAEGPLWPDIIRYYQPESRLKDLLVLRRRDKPLDKSILEREVSRKVMFNQALTLLRPPKAQFLTAKIEKTWLGHLADLLFRPPAIRLEVTYTDGHVGTYRLIADIAENGFVVSPLVDTADAFLLLETGQSAGFLPSATQIAFATSWLGSVCYQPLIRITLRPIASAYLKTVPIENPAITQFIRSEQILIELRKSASRPEAVRLTSQGLLAPAPMVLTDRLDRATSRVKFNFGILPGVKQLSGVRATCFGVGYRRQKETKLLFERCLNPNSAAADRGQQIGSIDAPLEAGDTVIFQTKCRKGCVYGWPYWSHVSFD